MWTTFVCYGNFVFESVIPKALDSSYVQSFSSITRHLNNGIWKTRYNCRIYGHESTQVSSLHQDIWLIIVCFSFSQTSPVFSLTSCWSNNDCHNLFCFAFWYYVNLEVYPDRTSTLFSKCYYFLFSIKH